MCNHCNTNDVKHQFDQYEKDKSRYFIIIVALSTALILSLAYIFYLTYQNSQYDYIEYTYTQSTTDGDNHVNLNVGGNADGGSESNCKGKN